MLFWHERPDASCCLPEPHPPPPSPSPPLLLVTRTLSSDVQSCLFSLLFKFIISTSFSCCPCSEKQLISLLCAWLSIRVKDLCSYIFSCSDHVQSLAFHIAIFFKQPRICHFSGDASRFFHDLPLAAVLDNITLGFVFASYSEVLSKRDQNRNKIWLRDFGPKRRKGFIPPLGLQDCFFMF